MGRRGLFQLRGVAMPISKDTTRWEPIRQPSDPQRDIETLTLNEFEELLVDAKTPAEQDRLIDALCKVVA